MEWVTWPLYIFVFLASFSALWGPNIWLKMGFPELKKKTIGSIHYIPGIYPYGVSSRPLFIFVFLTSSWSSEAKYLAENGVSGTFWKNYWFHSKFSWRIPTCVAHDCKIEIFIGYFWMRWVVIRAGVYCPHLWARLVVSGAMVGRSAMHSWGCPSPRCTWSDRQSYDSCHKNVVNSYNVV